MKEEIQLPTKYIILIIVIFVSIVIGAIVFFTRNYLSHKDELNSLIAKEIKGRIFNWKLIINYVVCYCMVY